MSSKPSTNRLELPDGEGKKIRNSTTAGGETPKKEGSFFSNMKKKKSMPPLYKDPTSPKKLTFNVDNNEMEEQIKLNETKKKEEALVKEREEAAAKAAKEANAKLEEQKKMIEEENKKKEEKNTGDTEENQKNPPNLLMKKKSTKQIFDKQEVLRNFVESYFSENIHDKAKISQLFDKVSKKLLKSSNPEEIFSILNLALDQKKPVPPKSSLLKQQELQIKKDKEEHPRVNLKPVTLIKQIITKEPMEEDPIYQEYLKWKEENNLEKMIEYIKKKAQKLEKIEAEQEKNKRERNNTTTKSHLFSNLMKSQIEEKIEENQESNPKENKEKQRVKTSDEVFRNKGNENLFRTQTKIFRKPKVVIQDMRDSDLFDFSEINNNKNEEIMEDPNFAKRKYFYKYPFRKIDSKYNTETTNKTDDITDKFFEALYEKLVKQHAKCGPNCGHLKRFYQRIGFVNKYIQKEEVVMNKNLIDKIPYINEFDNSSYGEF